MEIRDLGVVLKEHPFFRGLHPKYIDLLTGCATNVKFDAGELICRAGSDANHFFIIRAGKVAVEVNLPQIAPMTIHTLEDGDVLGWSWLFPPYKWHFDSRAVALTRAIALDGKCLRGKCDEDHDLGYEMMTRFSAIIADQLSQTRLQLVDLYGSPARAKK
jgi:CRP-like cAMP-binding protein